MQHLFELRGTLDRKTRISLEIIGLFLFLGIWQLIALYINSKSILPSPFAVITSIPEMYNNGDLISNLLASIELNVWGYLEAIIFAIPLGFIIGLFPLFDASTGRYIDSMRFIPLTAMIGLFIAWFGIGSAMKAHFLAFGIFVYLLPIVVQRVKELDEVYIQTAYTLGSSKTQTIFKIFVPGVLSALSTDIRVLVAISWTYIIAAEIINMTGGIGEMIQNSARRSRIDMVFALLFIIIVVGVLQDKIFKYGDKKLFPQKYL